MLDRAKLLTLKIDERICFPCALVAMTIIGSLSEAVAQPYYYPPALIHRQAASLFSAEPFVKPGMSPLMARFGRPEMRKSATS
jgi:hypothetical protein